MRPAGSQQGAAFLSGSLQGLLCLQCSAVSVYPVDVWISVSLLFQVAITTPVYYSWNWRLPTNSRWNPDQETQIRFYSETSSLKRKLSEMRSTGQVLSQYNPRPCEKGRLRPQTWRRKSRWRQEEKRVICKPRTGTNNPTDDLSSGFHDPVLWRRQTHLGFSILWSQQQQWTATLMAEKPGVLNSAVLPATPLQLHPWTLNLLFSPGLQFDVLSFHP